jgi:malate synthase
MSSAPELFVRGPESCVNLPRWLLGTLGEANQTEAKPFTWRANPDEIIAARNRGFQMLDSIH